jgi:hypothetical protein
MPNSLRGAMTELLETGDALAAASAGLSAEADALAEKWQRLRGEVHHGAHLLLGELALIVQHVKDES